MQSSLNTRRNCRITLLASAWAVTILAVAGQKCVRAVEILYDARSQQDPTADPKSGFTASTGGSAQLPAGAAKVLKTTDTDANVDGKFYFLRSESVQADQQSDWELTVVVGAKVSQGHPAATSVRLPIKASGYQRGPLTKGGHGEAYQEIVYRGHRIGFALVSDGQQHDQDEVLLMDFGNPGEHNVLGRRKLSVLELRKYGLSIQRSESGKGEDRVVLKIDAPNVEPIVAPLQQFALCDNDASSGLTFGHLTGAGVAEADWQELRLRVKRPANTGGAKNSESVADVVRTIGHQRQLFVDSWLIHRMEGLEREQGQPRKNLKNPVLRRDKPWEDSRCELYGSAIWNSQSKELDLFYSATKQPYDARLALAKSTNEGRTWIKPGLDVYPWEGQPSNIVWPGRYWAHGPCVLFDPHDQDPSRRYKMFLTAAPVNHPEAGMRGIDVVFSPDGIHWTAAPSNPVIPDFNSDTGNSVVWDDQRKLYRAYVRVRSGQGRSVGLTESKDFLTWSEPRIIYWPSKDDQERKWEFYGMSVTPYEDHFVGLVWIFPNTPASVDGKLETPVTWPELVVSRDGENWQRPFPGEAFLPLGPKGSFDHRQIRTASSMNVLDDRILLLYCGSPDAHVSSHKWDIGLATLRRDGFASLSAKDAPGSVLTKPLVFPAGELLVNADVKPGGYVRAELVDAQGQPLAGYSAEQCEGVKGDQLASPIRWKSHASVPASTDSGVRLRFHLKNARLYAFWVQPPKN